ncbi:hypothetical protein CVIRNUC_005471 [Coccomyxa viridis]|uniref:Thiol-disulfide oxidoreductase DCC n=1 Tax=Coccomyxa viridis TaxID=1274662 RepID=A0AAV1I8X7_9CHLO|nr:hypothetical protein CVIRNUC_005471 [Coccomyxa viridis]
MLAEQRLGKWLTSGKPAPLQSSHSWRPRRSPALKRCVAAVSSSPSVDTAAVFATDKRPIVLFDGVCNLCNGGVRFALTQDPQESLRFAALQSNIGRALLQRCGRQPDDISSIVLVEEDACHIKSEAILRIGRRLRQPFPVGAAPLFVLPGFLRDGFYDQIAGSRYNVFGKQDVCQLQHDQHADRFLQ